LTFAPHIDNARHDLVSVAQYVAAIMHRGQSLRGPPFGGLRRRSNVTVAAARDKELSHGKAQAEQLRQTVPLDLVEAVSFVQSRMNRIDELLKVGP
jgi:hypothetical protein